jgi:hypothetical protein
LLAEERPDDLDDQPFLDCYSLSFFLFSFFFSFFLCFIFWCFLELELYVIAVRLIRPASLRFYRPDTGLGGDSTGRRGLLNFVWLQ